MIKIFAFLFLANAAAVAGEQRLKLEAVLNGKIERSHELVFATERSAECKVVASDGKELKPDATLCEKLTAWGAATKTQLAKISEGKTSGDRPRWIADEPEYRFVDQSRTLWVPLKFPRTCEVKPGGDTHCVNAKLTASENLVFSLRELRQTHVFR